jgi:hypothetical protein
MYVSSPPSPLSISKSILKLNNEKNGMNGIWNE